MANWRVPSLVAVFGIGILISSYARASEPAITTYGERNAEAPSQLGAFSFLVGRWQGSGKTRLANGNYAQFSGVTWIGRYVLNGMAIADEFHASTPDGKSYLGISLRQYDTTHKSWVIEYLNVTNSFLRRQVNPLSGSVVQKSNAVEVISGDGPAKFRESYRVTDTDHFIYSADTSRDSGRSWDPSIEISMKRVE
jgi:Protein of unknown function (DUF1579)